MKKQTTTQQQRVIRHFLESKKGSTFNAIQARNLMRTQWGLDYDWHCFGQELDEMERLGLATITKPGGYVEYFIEFKPVTSRVS